MKFITLLIFSIEVFSTFVKSHPLDFTSNQLEPKDVEQHTLKTKNSQDSREVKLFVSMYSDGFDSVLDGKTKVWGDDKNYKCAYAKVYFKDEEAVGIKLGLYLKKPGNFAPENSKIVFLRKVRDTWLSSDRKVFWEFARKIFDLNYAHKGFESDEEFDIMEPNLDVARPPSDNRKHHEESPLKPNLAFEKSPEKAKELKDNEGKDSVSSKPREEPGEAHPMIELDKITDPKKDSSESDLKSTDKKEDSDPKGNLGEKGEELRLRKKQDEKTVVTKEVKKGKASSFLTNSLVLPGILIMLYTFT